MEEQSWLEREVYGDPVIHKSPLKVFLEANLDDDKSKLHTINNYYWYRQQINYDCIVGTTGFEGSGKSNLTIEQAEDLSNKNHLYFDYEENIIYNPEYASIMRAIVTLPEKSSLVIDEAIRTMYARNWNNRQQKEMNTMFATIRKRNLAIFINIPSLAELDSFFKNIRLLAWQHIFERGKAGIFVKDPNPFNSDPFNIKLSKKIIEEGMGKDRFRVDDMILKLKQNVPNFITNFKFDALSEKKEEKYKRLAKKYLTEIPEEEQSARGKLKSLEENLVVDLYESSPKWTVEKLSKRFSLSEHRVRTLIKAARGEKIEEEPAKVSDANGNNKPDG